MKRIALVFAAVILLHAAVFADEQEISAEAEDKGTGLTVELQYYSTYLWRGTYFFNGDGAFLPSISWDVLNSGFVLNFLGEFAASYFFEGNNEDINGTGFGNHGLDFGAVYNHTFDNTFSLGAGFWYYWYFNSSTSWATERTNLAFLSANWLVKLDILPLKPTFTMYYDYYTAIDRGGDLYWQLSFGDSIKLADGLDLDITVSAGYYLQNSSKSIKITGVLKDTVTRTPLKKGFSDINFLFTMIYKKGHVGLKGGFDYTIVPSLSWYKGSDIHRFYSYFGASMIF